MSNNEQKTPISDLKDMILRSLAITPATHEELIKRDFLKNISPEGVDRILHWLEQEKKIYCNGDKYTVYGRVKEQIGE